MSQNREIHPIDPENCAEFSEGFDWSAIEPEREAADGWQEAGEALAIVLAWLADSCSQRQLAVRFTAVAWLVGRDNKTLPEWQSQFGISRTEIHLASLRFRKLYPDVRPVFSKKTGFNKKRNPLVDD